MTRALHAAALALVLAGGGVVGRVAAAPDGALPTAAELQARHLEAVGGAAVLESLAALRLTGELQVEGQQIRAAWSWHADATGALDSRVRFPDGLQLGRGHQGEHTWRLDPGPRLLHGVEAERVARAADLAAAAAPARWLASAQTVGRVDFHGEDAWQVREHTHGGDTALAFYAVDSGLRVGTAVVTGAGPEPDVVHLTDWRVHHGLRLPHRRASWQDDLHLVVTVQDVAVHRTPASDPVPSELPVGVGTLVDPAAPRATAPLQPWHGLRVLPARLGDTPVTLLVDTGANVTVLTPAAAARAGLAGALEVAGFGTGGAVGASTLARVPALTVGARTWHELAALVVELGTDEIDGILGADVLHACTVELDRDRLQLWPRGTGPDLTGLVAVPVRRFEGDLLAVDLTVGERVTVPALVDTGGDRTVLPWRVARAFGFIAGDPAGQRDGELLGADGRPMSLWALPFPSLCVGAACWTGPTLAVANLPVLARLFPEARGAVLGADVLGTRRVVVDYEGQLLWLDPQPPLGGGE